MQRKLRLVSTLCALACAASLAPAARAAELGEASVRSFIGQQLAADIELVSLTPDEAAGLQVRLAPADVYQGASITMNPALASVHLSVVRRDQRQFLHITTLKPVDANYVHLFLELGVPGHYDVRAATLWLQADPHPAPSPAPAPVAVAPAPQPAGATPAELEAGAEAALRAARARVARPAAAATFRTPVVPPLVRERSEAACAPQAARPNARECVMLDRRSAALTEKLVALEDKVKVLQTALNSKTTPDSKPAPDSKPVRAHVPPRAGASRPASTKLKYKKEAPVETGPDLTTLVAGGGALLLALAGGGYYWLRRRKQGGSARAPLKIWQGWRRKKGEKGAEADADAAPPAKDALNQAE
jgi:pilus assembly protein FimV